MRGANQWPLVESNSPASKGERYIAQMRDCRRGLELISKRYKYVSGHPEDLAFEYQLCYNNQHLQSTIILLHTETHLSK